MEKTMTKTVYMLRCDGWSHDLDAQQERGCAFVQGAAGRALDISGYSAAEYFRESPPLKFDSLELARTWYRENFQGPDIWGIFPVFVIASVPCVDFAPDDLTADDAESLALETEYAGEGQMPETYDTAC